MSALGRVEVVVIHLPPGWAKRVERDLADIKSKLGIIQTEQEHDMAELDDRLAEIAADEDAEHAELARLIQDFEAAPGILGVAQRQALDAIKAHITGDTAAIIAADPEPTASAVEPAPAEVPADTATEVPAG